MIDNLSRRALLRLAAGLAAGLALPDAVTCGDRALVIVDVIIDSDTLAGAIRLGQIVRVEGEQGATLHCTLDADRAWSAVVLRDDEGREWRTEDRGRTFRHGSLFFEMT